MSFLLDTCLLSELPKITPNPGVVDWIHGSDESRLFVSVLTLGELLKGVHRLADGRRKQAIAQWFETDVQERFRTRILPVDVDVCRTWARIGTDAERTGHPRPAIDSLLAATAVAHGLTLITRNLDDFAHLPVNLFNPWT